ncbi:MAG TPA: hypothetical protein ENJ00_10810 [Phycisphaerales bacterium]|nr:hypothetical protein [Phycisphaerales bacterium]
MNRTKREPVAPIRPSARDPISQWLDVFTRLLGLPDVERQRIRDELEDHLRNRVDDLMILGMPEVEAVCKAVAELGETADLAKRFKAAHHSPNRRFLMPTVLTAVAGTALAISVFNLGSSGIPPGSNQQAIAALQAQPEAEHGSPEDHRLDFDIPAGTLGEAFERLAESADVQMFVHWDSFADWGITPDTEIPIIPAKGLEMVKVKQFLDSVLGLEEPYRIAGRFEDGLVEIATQDYFDRRDSVTAYYDLSDLVPADHPLEYTDEGETIRRVITETIEPEIWASPSGSSRRAGPGGYGRIAIIGSQMTIKAPERIQRQVTEFIEKLKQAQRQLDRASEYEAQQAREALEAERVAELERLASMKEQFAKELENLTSELDSINMQYWEARYSVEAMERRYNTSEDEAESAEILPELIAARARLESIDTERGVMKERFDTVLHRIQQVESQWIGRQY